MFFQNIFIAFFHSSDQQTVVLCIEYLCRYSISIVCEQILITSLLGNKLTSKE